MSDDASYQWLSAAQPARSLHSLAAQLQTRDPRNSGAAAQAAVAWFRAVCAGAPGSATVAEVQAHVRVAGAALRVRGTAGGGEFAALNVAPRLLRLLAEEADKLAPRPAPAAGGARPAAGGEAAVAAARAACAAALEAWPPVASTGSSMSSSSSAQAFSGVRAGILDALDELRGELELAPAAAAASAVADLLASADVVLVAGYDCAVRDCLLAAARRRRLAEVIICEASACAAWAPTPGASPVLAGHALALELTSRAKPLSVTLISDASAAAVMHRVTKVLLGARAVAADGSVLADAPALLVALAAQTPRVPVIVLANALAFCPRDVAPDAAGLEQLAALHGGCDPNSVLSPRAVAATEAAYADALARRPPAAAAADDDDDDGDDAGLVVAAADLDVLAPDLVRVIVTNAGVFAPAQAERVLEELYG